MYQKTILVANIDEFNNKLDELLKKHRKRGAKVEFYNSFISPGYSVYHAAMVTWDEEKVVESGDQFGPS